MITITQHSYDDINFKYSKLSKEELQKMLNINPNKCFKIFTHLYAKMFEKDIIPMDYKIESVFIHSINSLSIAKYYICYHVNYFKSKISYKLKLKTSDKSLNEILESINLDVTTFNNYFETKVDLKNFAYMDILEYCDNFTYMMVNIYYKIPA